MLDYIYNKELYIKNLAQRIGRKYSEIKQNSKNYHFYGSLPVYGNFNIGNDRRNKRNNG